MKITKYVWVSQGIKIGETFDKEEAYAYRDNANKDWGEYVQDCVDDIPETPPPTILFGVKNTATEKPTSAVPTTVSKEVLTLFIFTPPKFNYAQKFQ